MNCTDHTDYTDADGQRYPKDQWDPYRTKTNYTEKHGKARMQMCRDSVTLRENPCSNKNIRSIREIRTEQKTNTEIHGTTRRQVRELY